MGVLERMSPAEMRAEVSRLGLSKKAKKARANGSRARKAPEAEIQRAVVKWLAIQENMGVIMWFAVPNGGTRNILEAVNLKRQGVRRGVPDLVVIPKTGPVCFIELKSESGRLSKDQSDWLELLPLFGCPVAVCRSLDEVREFLFQTGVIREVA
jgi:hypothetical protein